MNNISHLSEIINSMNGMLYGLRAEVDMLRKEIVNLNVGNLKTQIDTMQTNLDNLARLDKVEKLHKTIDDNDKIILLEENLSDKLKSFQRTINDNEIKYKLEVQEMINQSIGFLLEGLRVPQDTSLHVDDVSKNVPGAQDVDVPDVPDVPEAQVVDAPLIISMTPSEEQPKPKRGGKRTTTKKK
jgi:hypothetical protein